VYTLLILLHVVICMGLILVILMQSSKGEGLAGAFGGTSLTGAVFGGRGAATFLSKATSIMAIAFMVSSLTLAFISPSQSEARRESSIKKQLENAQPVAPAEQPSGLPGESNQQGGDVQLPPANESGNQSQPAQGQ
jgi:preprotein translocase subunit SecG